MKKEILIAIATVANLGGWQPCLAQTEINAFVCSDEKWNQLIKDGQSALDNDKAMPAIGVFKRALSQIQRSQQDEKATNRMTAITNVKLGRAYIARGEYVKADQAFKDAKIAYDKLSIDDAELRTASDELAKYFKSIDPNSLGESVTTYLKEANVSSIAIFLKKDEGDLIEITLPQKYVKPLDSKDVPKVSFNKKVSFQFLTKPNGDYQVSKIQGMQVLAKSLWVNLMESLFKVGETPVAEVTAGKMGVTKTVTVNIPTEMYKSTKQMLDKMIASIKGQPAYAAEIENTSKQAGATGVESSSGASKFGESSEVQNSPKSTEFPTPAAGASANNGISPATSKSTETETSPESGSAPANKTDDGESVDAKIQSH
jgi:hypothetical protein